MTNDSLKQELLDFLDDQIDVPVELQPPAPDSDIAERMRRIQWDLIKRVGDIKEFSAHLGQIIRDSIDYVIDAPVLRRYTIDQIDPDEKTAIGKRIERLMKYQFNLPTGNKLDIILAEEEVDIKTTMGKNWMFSRSSHNHVNLLLAYNERTALYQLGLALVQLDGLNAGKNRDDKQNLSAASKAKITWIYKEQPYPPNFLGKLAESTLQTIVEKKTGMKRVIELLRRVNDVAIPRHVICSVANQKDPMRRIRSNGGARDVLWEEGLLVLSGAYDADRTVAREVHSIDLADDELMSLRADDSGLSPATLQLYKEDHALS